MTEAREQTVFRFRVKGLKVDRSNPDTTALRD